MTSARFLPWAREGLCAALKTPDPGDGKPMDARAELAVTASIGGTSTATASTVVRVYGPADVTSLDGAQVIRVEPNPGSADFEPNLFPLIELDRPDLPWLFTPAAATAGDRLRPWLCLVVVTHDEATLVTPPDGLTVAKLVNAGSALPPLDQSWAWVHAQVAGEGTPEEILRSPDASRTLSRLLCPRKLEPLTRYHALVVPTFEQGRLAALGRLETEVASTAQLAPAWTSTTAALELPVFHRWEFTTAETGDFESLVSSLQRFSPAPAPGESVTIGRHPMRVSDLPGGLPDLGEVQLAGALGLAGTSPDPLPPPAFTAPLQTLLNMPQPAPAGTAPPPGLPLPPPLYGRWHAAQPTVSATGGAPWMRALNLDPVSRTAAGLGTRIVVEQQEELMAAAWAQAPGLLEANRALRQAQLARAADAAHHAALHALADADLLMIAGPVSTHVRYGTRTVTETVRQSRVPAAMTRPAFRRALRPRGPLGRRSGSRPGTLLEKVNSGVLIVVPDRQPPPGTVLVGAIRDQPRLCQLDARLVSGIPLPVETGTFTPWHDFAKAAMEHQATLPPCDPVGRRGPAPLPLAAVAAGLRAALNPEVTVPARVLARVMRPPGWSPADPIEPILVAPQFPTPMYRALAAVSQELLLPGIGTVPPNSVTGLSTNPAFVEAFMVGLNHEMSRELAWRRFPTDQRGTYFRQFWDPAARVPQPGTADERLDIPVIDGWKSTLGDHQRGGEQFVLLIRGDLLARYPRTAIYLAQAEWYDESDGTKRRRPRIPAGLPSDATYREHYPLFSGTLEPDVTFIGFPITQAVARGLPDAASDKPGCFVVLQQQATELRFGIDATAPEKVVKNWRDLWWGNVPLSSSGHVDVSKPLTGIDPSKDPYGLSWAATSADQAAITTQAPFRAAIHASDLVAPA